MSRVIREKEGEHKPTRYYSHNQEKNVAKNMNGKTQPNSGATPFAKGDVILDEWLIECKTKTDNANSMSIKKEWLEKNEKEALYIGKPYNALFFNFGPGEDNYVIISETTFQELINK